MSLFVFCLVTYVGGAVVIGSLHVGSRIMSYVPVDALEIRLALVAAVMWPYVVYQKFIAELTDVTPES